MRQLLISFFLFILVQNLYGWGNRGHSEIVRIATELLRDKSFSGSIDEINNLNYFEKDKLIYYSIVPDIVWYSDSYVYPTGFSKYDEKVCHGPNIYFSEPLSKFPETISFLKTAILGKLKLHGASLSEDKNFLSAPDKAKIKQYIVYEKYHQTELAGFYRIFQLVSLSIERIKNISDHRDFQMYLESLGFLSHYLGDLNMPLHASPNFYGKIDIGYNTHKYIENDIVNLLSKKDWDEITVKAEEKFNFYLQLKNRKNLFDILIYDLAQSLDMIDRINRADNSLEERKLPSNIEKQKSYIKNSLVNSIASTSQVFLLISKYNENFNDINIEMMVNQKSDNFRPVPEWIIPDLPPQSSVK